MNGRRTFSQFLSATIGPSVARVSAPRTTPSLYKHPTIVVPVLVALGGLTPLFSRNSFLCSGMSIGTLCEPVIGWNVQVIRVGVVDG